MPKHLLPEELFSLGHMLPLGSWKRTDDKRDGIKINEESAVPASHSVLFKNVNLIITYVCLAMHKAVK